MVVRSLVGSATWTTTFFSLMKTFLPSMSKGLHLEIMSSQPCPPLASQPEEMTSQSLMCLTCWPLMRASITPNEVEVQLDQLPLEVGHLGGLCDVCAASFLQLSWVPGLNIHGGHAEGEDDLLVLCRGPHDGGLLCCRINARRR